MRRLDVRRHTMRRKPGHDLSQAGVDLARSLAWGEEGYDWVATSSLPRAIQTAVAMGYAVSETYCALGELPEAIYLKSGWPQGLPQMTAKLHQDSEVKAFAEQHAALWRQIAQNIPAQGSGLLISHGGLIELGLFGLATNHDFSQWGPAFGYCEGARLMIRNDGTVAYIEPLRVAAPMHLISN